MLVSAVALPSHALAWESLSPAERILAWLFRAYATIPAWEIRPAISLISLLEEEEIVYMQLLVISTCAKGQTDIAMPLRGARAAQARPGLHMILAYVNPLHAQTVDAAIWQITG